MKKQESDSTRSLVFISYATKDGEEFAKKAYEQIKRWHFQAWIAPRDISAGEAWDTRIDEALQEAFAVVVIVTPAALTSSFVTYEWAYALGRGARVIPVLFGTIEWTDHKLRTLHYVDCSEKPTDWKPLEEALHNAQRLSNTQRLSTLLGDLILEGDCAWTVLEAFEDYGYLTFEEVNAIVRRVRSFRKKSN